MSELLDILKVSAGMVGLEAKKAKQLYRAKRDLEKIKGQVEAHYLKLGELYYTQGGSAGVTGKAYEEICRSIQDLEMLAEFRKEDIRQVKVKNKALKEMQTRLYDYLEPARAALTPPPLPVSPPCEPLAEETLFCPNCGEELPDNAASCSECGAIFEESLEDYLSGLVSDFLSAARRRISRTPPKTA